MSEQSRKFMSPKKTLTMTRSINRVPIVHLLHGAIIIREVVTEEVAEFVVDEANSNTTTNGDPKHYIKRN
jgi:hypothetical protein